MLIAKSGLTIRASEKHFLGPGDTLAEVEQVAKWPLETTWRSLAIADILEIGTDSTICFLPHP
jgi:hypothetical protein